MDAAALRGCPASGRAGARCSQLVRAARPLRPRHVTQPGRCAFGPTGASPFVQASRSHGQYACGHGNVWLRRVRWTAGSPGRSRWARGRRCKTARRPVGAARLPDRAVLGGSDGPASGAHPARDAFASLSRGAPFGCGTGLVSVAAHSDAEGASVCNMPSRQYLGIPARSQGAARGEQTTRPEPSGIVHLQVAMTQAFPAIVVRDKLSSCSGCSDITNA